MYIGPFVFPLSCFYFRLISDTPNTDLFHVISWSAHSLLIPGNRCHRFPLFHFKWFNCVLDWKLTLLLLLDLELQKLFIGTYYFLLIKVIVYTYNSLPLFLLIWQLTVCLQISCIFFFADSLIPILFPSDYASRSNCYCYGPNGHIQVSYLFHLLCVGHLIDLKQNNVLHTVAWGRKIELMVLS